MIKQAVILCGGKGTRLGDLTKEFPKPLLPIQDEALLDRTIKLLAGQGFERFLLAAGFRADLIIDHYKENPIEGVTIETIIEETPLGTSGCLHLLADQLDEDFLLVYGDVFLDLDCRALADNHESTGAMATLLVRQSDHPWDSDLVDADDDGRVTALLSTASRDPDGLYKNIGNAALYALNKGLLEFIGENEKSDFCKDIFPRAIEAGSYLQTYFLPDGEWCKDMGTPDRLTVVETYLAQKERIAEAPANPKPIDTILIDRDGTLNTHDMSVNKGFVTQPNELHLLPGAAEAVRLFNEAGMRVFVLTNQPGIARGLYDFATLDAIHAKLETDLAAEGAKVDGIYFSPFHPETQYAEGLSEYRRASDCRKPGIGMIMQVVEQHDIDLASTCFIGDTWRDVRAGKNAGVRTILVENTDDSGEIAPDMSFPTTLAAARHLTADVATPTAS